MDEGYTLATAGEGYLGSAPAFGDVNNASLSGFLEKPSHLLNFRHTAFLGPTGQDSASTSFPFLLPGAGTCQQQCFGGLISQSGLRGTQALAVMGREAGWTFLLSSTVYGVHGSLGLQGLVSGTYGAVADEN